MLLRNIAVTCLRNDDSLKCTGIVYMRKMRKGFGRACSPAPASSQSNIKGQGCIPWEGGALWVCGDGASTSM